SQVHSQLLPGVSFVATGGSYVAVTVTAGAGNDQVDVQSTLSTAATTVNGGPGDDLVVVSSNAPGAGDPQGIAPPLALAPGPGANNSIVLDGHNVSTGYAGISVTATTVAGFAGPSAKIPINYAATGGSTGLTLVGTDSADHFVVNNPGASLVVDARDGADSVL